MIDESIVSDLANVFLALSDKTRLRLVACMASGEASVNFLADTVGQSQPKVSRHLAYLRAMNVVSTRRDGKQIFYALNTRSDSAAASILLASVEALGGSANNNAQRHDVSSSPVSERFDRATSDELPIYLL